MISAYYFLLGVILSYVTISADTDREELLSIPGDKTEISLGVVNLVFPNVVSLVVPVRSILTLFCTTKLSPNS